MANNHASLLPDSDTNVLEKGQNILLSILTIRLWLKWMICSLDYIAMRKTGAYRVYVQSNHNIGLIMKLLNHSSEQMTLDYLGLDRELTESMLDKIDFG